jgi:hypothetical protein
VGQLRRNAKSITYRVGASVLVVLVVAGAPSAGFASAHPSAAPARAQTIDRAAGPPPSITRALRNLATRFSFIRLRATYRDLSDDEIGALVKRVVKKWASGKAKECPSPLPRWFFCSRPAEPQWGRGMAVDIGGQWPGEFYSPWSPSNPPRVLRPGYVFWLTCWSSGAVIDNGVFRSNLWYRLTNGLWASDAWLYTGTNEPLPNVGRCQVSR